MAGTRSDEITTADWATTDWPTLVLIAAFWALFVGVLSASSFLPLPIVVVALGLLGALFMSLQHEVIHGHPTRSAKLNTILVGLPCGLVLPLARYRESHLAHHRSDLTDPVDDPESFYVLAETWNRAGWLKRSYLRANRTLAGRMLLGPLTMTWLSVADDVAFVARDAKVRVTWVLHLLGATVVVGAVYVSPLPIWAYALGFVYIGSSLTLLRSFIEHRAVVDAARPVVDRSAIVRSGWFFSLLFLNNNLHYTHHRFPGVAWYRLPVLTRELDAVSIVADSAGTYDGYGSIVRRYLFRPFGQPVHPISGSIRA